MGSKLISGGKPFGAGICEAAIGDAELIDFLAAYRRQIAGNYRSLPPDEIDQLPPERMLVLQKLDGELWFLVSREKKVFLANSRGLAITGEVPLLKQVKSLPDRTVIAGELYARVEGRRSRVGDLAAAMGGGKKAKTENVCFAAFDLLQDPDSETTAAYDVRHEHLEKMLKSSSNLSVIPVETLNTSAQVRDRFEATVSTGETEGLIIRLDSGLIYKLKPSISVDAVVIGYTIRSDQQDMVRSILLGLMHEDGRIQLLGGCGNLGSDDNRKELLTRLAKIKTDSAVRYASQSGSLYTFVNPEIVAEIRVTDLQSDRSDGNVASSVLLSHGKAGWIGHGMRPSPRPIHPTLERLRSDKKVDTTDVRFAQIAQYLPPGEEKQAVNEMLPSSKILRREVWTKETKGQVAVRKLLVWRTNKETVDGTFPAFVVYWTDFSASRSKPLNRKVSPAPDESEAMKIADAMVEENIKAGWDKIDS